MNDPAKLQLLMRSEGESGFEIFEIDSREVHSGFKPQRPPATDWELKRQPLAADGTRSYVLNNRRRDRYLLLSAKEHFLWEKFDGRNSLDEIARAFHFEYGAFDYSLIRELLAKLDHAGLIEGRRSATPPRNFVSARPFSKTSWLRRRVREWRHCAFRLRDADRYCAAIYRGGGFILFHPLTVALFLGLALLALAAAYRLAAHSMEFARLLSTQPLLSAAVILVTIPIASMLHVLAHALACKSQGRRVREIGFFLLQGILPTFYADVTDIFMADRRARLAVDLAGPLVEVFLGGAAMLGAYFSAPSLQQALLFGVGVLLWESALINLYPFSFLELDGYNVLADLLAMPMLRKQALSLMPNLIQALQKPRRVRRAELIQMGYLALCVVSVLVYLVLHLDAIRALLPQRLSLFS
jgi:putative peptide zinc metalloprotease protein